MRLPDFVIVGAQKAGTTAVLNTLVCHPDIGGADPFVRKMPGRRFPWRRRQERVITEPHFFTYRWDRGTDWYRSLFTSDAAVVGERTPAVLHHAEARRRLRTVIPYAKLIVLLRDPVARAYSHWNHYGQTRGPAGRATWVGESFDDAMRADRDWMFTRSRYGTHLDALFADFPRHQVFVGISERIRNEPQPEYDRLFDFLGVHRRPVAELTPRQTHTRRYTTPLDTTTKRRWDRSFAEEVGRVRTLLGDPLPEWPTAPAG